MTWTVSDGRGGTASADLVVTVEGGNNPPTVTCSAQSITLAGVHTWYWFGIPKSCFNDPDGDSITLSATQPTHGSVSALSSSHSCPTGAGTCWRYDPPSGWSGNAYQTTLTVTATDSHGAKSGPLSVTLCVNC